MVVNNVVYLKILKTIILYAMVSNNNTIIIAVKYNSYNTYNNTCMPIGNNRCQRDITSSVPRGSRIHHAPAAAAAI